MSKRLASAEIIAGIALLMPAIANVSAYDTQYCNAFNYKSVLGASTCK